MITRAHFVWLALSICGLTLSIAKSPSDWQRPISNLNQSIQKSADDALMDQFELQGILASPVNEDGSYNWDYRGPKDDKEWAWFLNRHRYFEDLYVAYSATKDSRYANKIFTILSDWIQQNKTPPSGMSFSSAWRPLEAARRILESWDLIYLKLWNDSHFPEALKPEFLEALANHGDYLMEHHALYGNHLITEMLALLKLSLLLPETDSSARWKEYALQRLDEEYHKQFYPNGTHKELSAHYQRVVTLNYQILLRLLEKSGHDENLAIWQQRLDRMWGYFNAISKPSGYAPLNNDSDLEYVRRLLIENQQSDRPSPQESYYFPQAGQVVFRDFEQRKTKLWAFFDIGPRGTDHQHEDFLHLSLSLNQANFLVDNGRYTYRPGPWREYFQGPCSHNLILLDDITTQPKAKSSDQPLPGSGYIKADHYEAAWGEGSFRDKMGNLIGSWQRNVLLLPEVGLLVLDQVICFRPRQLVGYWHAHPDVTLDENSLDLLLQNSKEKLSFTYANTQGLPPILDWISGENAPRIQGWHSPRFNEKLKSPVIRYTTTISKPTIFAWLFSPEKNASKIEQIHSNGQTIHLSFLKNGVRHSLTIGLPSRDGVLTLSNDSN